MRKHLAVRIAATLAALFVALNRLAAQPLTITHLAGTTGGNGWFDGTGSAARFSHPSGVTVDGSGNLYVSDSFNHTIRKVARTGDVSTLAGLAGSDGGADGTGSAARFNQPYGVAVDGSGNVYVADSFNSTIRKITPSGVVSTLAGLVGNSGSADGVGSAARFGRPFGIAMDGSGNLFVADRWNDTIRKVVVATGEVTTIAGLSGASGSADGIGSAARFYYPNGVVVDGSGNVYVAEDGNSTIRRIVVATGEVTTLAGSAGSTGSADGTGSAARFNGPEGVAADGLGNLFVADTFNSTIRKIVIATGEVTTLAGLAGGFGSGSADGVGSEARFYDPYGVASDASGTLYVADTYNDTIRRVIVATGEVTTLAGLARSSGSEEGSGPEARFDQPYGVAVDDSGNVYVADTYNCTIRKVTPASIVSTLAGLAGSCGSADGTGAAARFNGPRDLAADGLGNLFVADTFNSTIRKIVVATGEVTTLAGLAGFNTGTADGIGSAARFFFPGGIATDGSGNLYVADTDNNAIRMIVVSTRQVTTLAGLKGILNDGYADGIGNAARFEFPLGVAADRSGNVFVADNNTIRKIVVSTAQVTTLVGLAGSLGTADGTGSEARFVGPSGVAVDGSGNLFVADTQNYTIRKVVVATREVTTVAGMAWNPGNADGVGSAARFDTPRGVAADGSGSVFIADTGNNCIRKGTTVPGLADSATIDAAAGLTGQVRQFDTSPRTATRWLWEEIRRPSGSAATLSSTTIRNPTFTPDVPDLYIFRLTASDESGSQNITAVSLTAISSPAGSPLTRLLPIVLDVSSGPAHYMTEMALTNNGMTMLSVSMLYTASLGSEQGSGTVTDILAPGEQKKIGDVLSYLRNKGLAIPSLAEQPQQGGTLLLSFEGYGALDPKLVSVTARTAALTAAPQPLGRAGLAYSGLLEAETSMSSVTLYGLRSTPFDRTNVAVFNASSDPVTLKVTICSGSGDGRCVVFRTAETLSPYGWLQYGSNEILDGNGITKGWVTIERISSRGSFSAYGVINDNATNDGSFVLPVAGALAGSTLTVPVLVETSVFRSELILVNKSMSTVTLILSYVESISPSSGAPATITVTLAPMEEQIVPEAVDYLRGNGVNIGAKDAASYGGALRVSISGTTADNVFAGARTASQSSAGGQFGLFTPCVYSGQEASTETYLYGLRADAENRTNVAVVNAGNDSAGPILLQLQTYDGDAGGVPKGDPASVALVPGQWAQPADFFKNSGVTNGWVKVTRMSGTAPWIAYGVINDGGNPGERTGDGAYVPMVK